MATKEARQFVFSWTGTNDEGEALRGQTEGASQAAVKVALRRQGIIPGRVRKKTTIFGFGGGQRRSKKIKPADIATFARQIATMMAAGVPLVQTLDVIARGHKNPAMESLVDDVRNNIEAGSTLAESLARHPRYFDSLFVNLVAAGEASGALEQLLDRIATYKEKTEALKAKVRKAMYYPAAVICAAIAVMAILLYFVVPQFQALFQGFGAQLPAFTRLVIGLSQWVQDWWWAAIIAIVVGTFLFRRIHGRSHAFHRAIDRLLLKLPIVGNILYKGIVARFMRTLATMFAAGVPLVEALDAVAGAAGNDIFEEGIRQMRSQVASGQRLKLAMSNTGLFPNMAEQMVAIGEESSALDDMCNRVAAIYEAEVDNQVDALSSLLEPLIIVVIGILVGGLVIAMYLPIFQIGSVV